MPGPACSFFMIRTVNAIPPKTLEAKKKPADTDTANRRIKLSVGQRLLRSELNRISPEERHPMMHVNPKVVLMKADGDCFDHPVKHFCSERMSRTGAS